MSASRSRFVFPFHGTDRTSGRSRVLVRNGELGAHLGGLGHNAGLPPMDRPSSPERLQGNIVYVHRLSHEDMRATPRQTQPRRKQNPCSCSYPTNSCTVFSRSPSLGPHGPSEASSPSHPIHHSPHIHPTPLSLPTCHHPLVLSVVVPSVVTCPNNKLRPAWHGFQHL